MPSSAPRRARCRLRRAPGPDQAAGWAVLDGVFQHVDQHLLQQRRVGERDGRRLRHADADMRLAGQAGDGGVDATATAHRGEAGIDLAAFQPGQVGDVGQEPRHAGDILLDAVQQVDAGRVRQLVPRRPQRAGGAADAGQRRAQVVAQRGEQGGAQPLGLLHRGGARRLAASSTRSQATAAWSARAARACSSGSSSARVAAHAQHAERRAHGAQRQEPPGAAGQRAGAAAGRLAVGPGPSGRRPGALVHGVGWRVGGADVERAPSGVAGASTSARPAMAAAWRAISASRSGSVAASPSLRLNAPIRRRPSMRRLRRPRLRRAPGRPGRRTARPRWRTPAAPPASCGLPMVIV